MIRPEEIEDIFEIGELHGQPVKVIRTIGGFYAATAKDNGKDAVLAGGSHPALVRHTLVKKFGQNFRPNLIKSESPANHKVFEKTEFLPKSVISNGYSMSAVVSNDLDVEFIVEHYGFPIITQRALAKGESLEMQTGMDIKDTEKGKHLLKSGFASSLLSAAADLATNLNIENISYQEQPKMVKVKNFALKNK